MGLRMSREKRMRRVRAIKIAQSEDPFDLNDIPRVSSSGQFGNHELLRTDSELKFDTDNLDELFMQASNKEWITIPDEARRFNIPDLYYLNPSLATSHEKYFGVKTEYGFLHTPATAALFAAALNGSVPRKNMSEMKALEVPKELRAKVGMDQLFTLDSAGEQIVIGQATNFLLRSKNNPNLMRRFKVDQSGEVEMSTSHSRGLVREPGQHQVSERVDKKLSLLERGLDKGIESYPRLERTVNTFLETLSTRMESLIKEQSNTNRTIRFEGGRDETEDIMRQNILRLLLEALNGDDSPLRGSEVYEQDYKII